MLPLLQVGKFWSGWLNIRGGLSPRPLPAKCCRVLCVSLACSAVRVVGVEREADVSQIGAILPVVAYLCHLSFF